MLLLPPGWSALDALEAELPPVAPGTDYVVDFRARADVADAATAASPVQAAVYVEALVLGSNVVQMRVAGRPRLDGPASGVRIEPAGAGTLRVCVTVVNEGDAAARTVRVVAPAPPGFAAAETQVEATRDELGVGESLTFSYLLVARNPVAATVRIDDAYVAYDGGRVALATVASVLLGAEIAPPDIVAERRATRLNLRVRVRNDGWVAARDVRCALELPAGWRIVRGTMRADGAPAAVRRDGDSGNGVSVALPLVPARGVVELSVVASASRPKSDGDIVVHCGDHAVSVPVPNVALRALRLAARPESAFAEPGSTPAIAVDVHNIGETTERVSVGIAGASCWTGELRAGAAAAFVARYVMPAEIGDGDTVSIAVIATAADETRLACEHFDLRAVERPWIAIDDVAWERGGRARMSVRNAGCTVARNVRVAGSAESLIGALAPGETHVVCVEAAVAGAMSLTCDRGGIVPVVCDEQSVVSTLAGALTVPPNARCGGRLDVLLRVTGDGDVQTLRVRPRPHPGAVYVPGSTSINGHAVVDGFDGAPLYAGAGLALHEIPAGTAVELSWSLLARMPGEVRIAVDADVDGVPVDIAFAIVAVADLPAFGARPNALPFHIDASTVGDDGSAQSPFDLAMSPASSALTKADVAAPSVSSAVSRADCVTPVPGSAVSPATPARTLPEAKHTIRIGALPAEPTPSDPEAFRLRPPQRAGGDALVLRADMAPAVTVSLALDVTRAASIVRVLRGTRAAGFISHLPSLAVLLPTTIASADPELDVIFAAAVDAIRGVYERLFVKLRIPGYTITSADLEDLAMRGALLALFERIEVPALPDRTDVSALPDRIDVNALPDRVDVNALPDRTDVNALPDRIDVSALPDRIDVCALPDRIDVSALPNRTDVSALPDRVDARSTADRSDARDELNRADSRDDGNQFNARDDVDQIDPHTGRDPIDARAALKRSNVFYDDAVRAAETGDMFVHIDCERISVVRGLLENAPLGGPQTLAAVAALLPRHAATDTSVALAAYVGEIVTTIDTACARASAQTPAQFNTHLAEQRTPAADAARAVVVATLDTRDEVLAS